MSKIVTYLLTARYAKLSNKPIEFIFGSMKGEQQCSMSKYLEV